MERLPINLTYDISVLGAGTIDNLSRTGIFRVAENLLLGLAGSEALSLQLSAAPEFLRAARKYIAATSALHSLDVVSTEDLGHGFSGRGSIFHSPFYAIPPRISANERITKFLTVCDLIPIKFPQFFTEAAVAHFTGILNCITPETRVFCISHSTKDDLCSCLPFVNPDNVYVTHLAASSQFHPVSDRGLISSVKDKYGIPASPYVLSLSTLEPRKNIDTAIQAFLDLIQQEKVPEINLVLVGSKGWKINSVLDKYSKNPTLRDRLIFTGYVQDEDLAALYSGALVFLYPSYYEGFGLPPLEAMQCGVPVITSNNSSLPEVVGEAGILVDANDSDALSQSILDVVSSEQIRSAMRSKSLAQARKFSWEKHTEATVTAYRSSQAGGQDFGTRNKSRGLKIGINFTGLIPGKIGGMEKYMRALVHYIPRLSETHELYVFLRPETMDEVEESAGVKRVCIKKVPEPDARKSEIHRAVKELGLDVWLSPLLILDPLTLGIPSLYCVPDLQHEYYPEFFSQDVLDWRERYFRKSAEIADAILTISDFSKKTIIDNYGVSPDKVQVTRLDCPTYFTLEKALEHEAYVREEFGLPRHFILYPANLWAHKNHLTLIRALECYEEHYGDSPSLVLTGYASDAHEQVLQVIRSSSIAAKIQFLGYVPKELMPAIYRNAACLAFPSMFEGFGIPLIEAMRTSCPIIAANNTTMKEIAGDAALYYNTMDEVELAVMIRFVVTNPALREFLIANGERRAAQFSFERCVQQTLDVIDDVYWRRQQARVHGSDAASQGV